MRDTFRTGVSHCFFIKNTCFRLSLIAFWVISHSYLSHHSKYIRCGPLYLFKNSSCLYVKSLHPICYPIYIIVLANRHFHRSTRVNRSLYNNELTCSPGWNDEDAS